jgi:predicted nucleic acid-binding protein
VKQYALDSNIIIERIRRNLHEKQRIDDAILQKKAIMIPPHAYYEVMRGIEGRNAQKQLQLFNELLTVCPLGEAPKEVFDEASHIYNELRRNGTPSEDDMDIMIAAFCRTYGLTLVTDNKKDFENVTSLSTENWLE